jgi:hypothetical protein
MGRRVRWGWGASSCRADIKLLPPSLWGSSKSFERKKHCRERRRHRELDGRRLLRRLQSPSGEIVKSPTPLIFT